MNIQILDHDRNRTNALWIGLTHDSAIHCVCIDDADDLLAWAEHDPDVLLIQVPIETENTATALRNLRAHDFNFPVILLANFAVVSNVELGFYLDAGADAILSSTSAPSLIAAQIRAMVRRRRAASPDNAIVCGHITLDIAHREVRVDGEPIHLTGKEYGLLELLMLRQGASLTKAAILDHLYGGRDEPEMKIVDVFVCKLRKKLGIGGGQIATDWGRGYRMLDTPKYKLRGTDTPAQKKVNGTEKLLRALGSFGEPTLAATVSTRADLRPNTVGTLLASLKRAGLAESVKTRNSPAHAWSLTDAGRRHLSELESTRTAAE